MKRPNFTWFLGGTTLTNAAQWIQGVTLNWLIFDITSSGTILGLLNLVRSFATVGLAPIAGVAIDKIDRKKLLYVTSTWLLIITLAFGLALLGNPKIILLLFLFSFLGGVAQAISNPLRQTLVFSVLPRHLVPTGVALVQTGWAVMRSIGPALGGYLILWVGPAGNFFVQAGAYALVLLTILKLNLPFAQQETESTGSKDSLLEGWKYVKSHRDTRNFILMSMMLPLLIIPNFNALPPIYAKNVFNGGPDTLGLLLSAIGVGGIVGGIFVASLGKFKRRGLLQIIALLLISVAFFGVSLSTHLATTMIFMAIAGFCEIIFITSNTTLIQLSIPDEVRGRVMGIVTLRAGITPLGGVFAGFSADLIGPRYTTMVFAALIALIAIAILVSSPHIRNHTIEVDTHQEETS